MDDRARYRMETQELGHAWSARGCLAQFLFLCLGALVVVVVGGLGAAPAAILLALSEALPDAGTILTLAAIAAAILFFLPAVLLLLSLAVLGFDVPWPTVAKVTGVVIVLFIPVVDIGVAYWVGKGLPEAIRRLRSKVGRS